MKRLLLHIIFLFSASSLIAATFSSRSNGNWNVGTTWGGLCTTGCIPGIDYPGISDDVDISPNTIVTIPASFAAEANTLDVGSSTYCGAGAAPDEGILLFAGATSSLQVRRDVSISIASTCVYFAGTYENYIDLNGGSMTVDGGIKLVSGVDVSLNFNAAIYLGGGTLNANGAIGFSVSDASVVSKIDFEGNPSSKLMAADSVYACCHASPVVASAQVICDSGLFELDGGAQTITIANNEFSKLKINGSGDKTFTDVDYLVITDTLEMASAAQIVKSPTGSTPSSGYIVYKNASTVLKYSGLVAQTTGVEVSDVIQLPNVATIDIPNLVIENRSATGVTLQDGEEIATSSLNLIDGILFDGNSGDPGTHIYLDYASGTSSTLLNSGSVSSYVSPGMIIEDGASNVVYEIPIGTSTAFTPVFVNPTTAVLNEFNAVAYDGAHPMVSDASRNVSHYWDLSNSDATQRFDIKLGWEPGNEGANFNANIPNGIFIGHYDSGWEEYSATFTNGVMRYAEISNYDDGFSPFGVGAGASALPVELVSFNLQLNDNQGIVVSWATASEINNDYFEVQRSYDGVDFETIDIIQGNGNSNAAQYYEAIDHSFQSDLIYYRLKQVDFDGRFEYSSIEVIHVFDYNSHKGKFELFPNVIQQGRPSIELFLTNQNRKNNVQGFVKNVSGSVIQRFEVNAKNVHLNTSALKAGIYIIELNDQFKGGFQKRLVVQ